MKNNRIKWIDIAKGITILLVIYGHSMRDEMRTASPFLDYTYRCVYIFHMAFFFWLSGYSYQMGRTVFHKNYNLSFVRKKIQKQLLPWILYTSLIYIAFTIATNNGNISSMLASAGYEKMPLSRYMMDAIQARNNWAYHLWFIYVLFIISILVFAFEQIVHNKKILYKGLTVLCLVGLFLVKAFDLGSWERLTGYICLFIPYYLIGILQQGKENDLRFVSVWGCFGLAYIFLRALLWSGFSGDAIDTGMFWSDLLVWYLAYLLLPGCFLLMREVCLRIAKHPHIANPLAHIGRESFLIYLFHQPFCCAFVGTVLCNILNAPILVTMVSCIILSIIIPYSVRIITARIRDIVYKRLRLQKDSS